ncbi:hypothetical protein SOASR030_29770 [Leminorella grimontii]|uniref:Uncharacterized protein n=1 Tax=Leminorella grimontii TaxID=82981 RepID=A0AAV5N429_9GAMM|nr:hypothetical protein SOASR030_29770 [Leminorella grimontii]GKX60813.1 hypothetical protein SOASR031_31280 [Leminorella grimontii]
MAADFNQEMKKTRNFSVNNTVMAHKATFIIMNTLVEFATIFMSESDNTTRVLYNKDRP